jgi:hypothetical protein
MHHDDPDLEWEDDCGEDKMTAQHVLVSSPLGSGARRRVPSEKRLEPRVLKMRTRTRRRFSMVSPATRVLAEALATLVLFLAMLYVLLAPE